MKAFRVFGLTMLAMIAFAGNSLLCRLALSTTGIDAATFTLVRMVSGAAVLWIIMRMRGVSSRATGNWLSALALFAYAAGFSFAYLELTAGTGALLLFGAVQATMILSGWRKGERLDPLQVAGLAIAIVGLVVLLLPGLSAPSLIGSILMLGAGVAWGIYSLRGRKENNPVGATAGNFLRAVPLAVGVNLITIPWARADSLGMICALLSGTLTSGLGYVIWYGVLPRLKAASAATVQLSVPVLAATGGIALLGEPVTLRYLLASITVLGGIALVLGPKGKG